MNNSPSKIIITEAQMSAFEEAQKIRKWKKESLTDLENRLHTTMAKISDQEQRSRIFNAYQKRIDKVHKIYFSKMGELDKAKKDYLGLEGDVNSKYLYHYTTTFNLLSILEENTLNPNDEVWDIISFTTNPNLWKRGFVFYHGRDGKNHTNVGARITFDFNKLKEKYKYKVGSEYSGVNVGEEEIVLKVGDGGLSPVMPYIVEILIIKAKVITPLDKKYYDEMIEILDKSGIKYTVR